MDSGTAQAASQCLPRMAMLEMSQYQLHEEEHLWWMRSPEKLAPPPERQATQRPSALCADASRHQAYHQGGQSRQRSLLGGGSLRCPSSDRSRCQHTTAKIHATTSTTMLKTKNTPTKSCRQSVSGSEEVWAWACRGTKSHHQSVSGSDAAWLGLAKLGLAWYMRAEPLQKVYALRCHHRREQCAPSACFENGKLLLYAFWTGVGCESLSVSLQGQRGAISHIGARWILDRAGSSGSCHRSSIVLTTTSSSLQVRG